MNSNLIFDCEYLNGNIHGYGKEFYDNGNLEFKGEYLNGERNGKGKQYYENGNLKFEGEFINDEIIADTKYDKNGNIIYQQNNSNKIRKTFDFDSGNLIFEGEYLNGVKNGNGKKYFYCFLEFEGKYLNGKNGTVRVMIPNKLFHMN